MTREHEQFEILCALAVSGQLTDTEQSELRLHIAQCADCRNCLQDMAQVSAQALMLHDEEVGRLPAGMEERFMLRAQAEGIPLQRMRAGSPGKSKMVYQYGCLAAATLLAVLAVVNLFQREIPAPGPFASIVAPQPSPIDVTSAISEHSTEATKKQYKKKQRMVAAFPARKFVVQSAEIHPLNALVMLRRFQGDSGLLPGAQAGISRQFHYDPSAEAVPRQISSLRFHVDWYHVWMESQENPKRLEISFQPEWKAGVLP